MKNCTDESFAYWQNELEFLMKKEKETTRIITHAMGKSMGEFAEKNSHISVLLFFLGACIGEDRRDMPLYEIKEIVEIYRPRIKKVMLDHLCPELKAIFEKYSDKFIKIFEQGIYYGQFTDDLVAEA